LYPKHLSCSSRSRTTLLGFSSPYSASDIESSRPPVSPGSYPTWSEDRIGVHRWLPHHRLRCRSQVFSTSQRLVSLNAALPFSDRWHSWGSPFRGLFLPRSLPRFITAEIPSCRCSRRLIFPGPRPGSLWACGTLPRMARTHIFHRLQGLRPRENRPHQSPRLVYEMTDLPLLGFSPPHGRTLSRVQSLRPTTVTLQRPLVCRQIRDRLRSTA
jgi:hypothetical protein